MVRANDLSIDTFYGIICSGLTDKTTLSFISSNSSFTECMRNHQLTSSFSNNSLSCSTSPYYDCTFTPSFLPEYSTSTVFTSCQFSSLSSSGNGGAISYSQSGAIITISSSQFYNCQATIGGAIYADSLHSLSVLFTSFVLCRATSTGSDAGGGGGAEVDAVDAPLFTACLFYQCSSGDDGGGIRTYNCGYDQQSQSLPTDSSRVKDNSLVQDSRFLVCSCSGSSTPSAGAILFWYNKETLGGSDCLFSKLHVVHTGGAIHVFYNSHVTGSHPIRFSFFTQNTADEGKGHDFCANCNLANTVFLNCFSTSGEKRVCTDEDGYKPGLRDDWLPSGRVKNVGS